MMFWTLYFKPPFVMAVKPPLGIIPKRFWQEKQNEERLSQLRLAILRYVEAKHPIPEEWITEYNELIKK